MKFRMNSATATPMSVSLEICRRGIRSIDGLLKVSQQVKELAIAMPAELLCKRCDKLCKLLQQHEEMLQLQLEEEKRKKRERRSSVSFSPPKKEKSSPTSSPASPHSITPRASSNLDKKREDAIDTLAVGLELLTSALSEYNSNKAVGRCWRVLDIAAKVSSAHEMLTNTLITVGFIAEGPQADVQRRSVKRTQEISEREICRLMKRTIAVYKLHQRKPIFPPTAAATGSRSPRSSFVQRDDNLVNEADQSSASLGGRSATNKATKEAEKKLINDISSMLSQLASADSETSSFVPFIGSDDEERAVLAAAAAALHHGESEKERQNDIIDDGEEVKKEEDARLLLVPKFDPEEMVIPSKRVKIGSRIAGDNHDENLSRFGVSYFAKLKLFGNDEEWAGRDGEEIDVAFKTVDISNDVKKAAVEADVALKVTIGQEHQNIFCYYGLCFGRNIAPQNNSNRAATACWGIVEELLPPSTTASLASLLQNEMRHGKSPCKKLHPKNKLDVAVQVAQAIGFLHRKGFVLTQKNICPENIMVRIEQFSEHALQDGAEEDDVVVVAKIMEIAAHAQHKSNRTSVVSTEFCQSRHDAPEVVVGGPSFVSTQSDIYNYGTLLYTMFGGDGGGGQIEASSQGTVGDIGGFAVTLHKNYGTALSYPQRAAVVAAVKSCWEPHPNERARLGQVEQILAAPMAEVASCYGRGPNKAPPITLTVHPPPSITTTNCSSDFATPTSGATAHHRCQRPAALSPMSVLSLAPHNPNGTTTATGFPLSPFAFPSPPATPGRKRQFSIAATRGQHRSVAQLDEIILKLTHLDAEEEEEEKGEEEEEEEKEKCAAQQRQPEFGVVDYVSTPAAQASKRRTKRAAERKRLVGEFESVLREIEQKDQQKRQQEKLDKIQQQEKEEDVALFVSSGRQSFSTSFLSPAGTPFFSTPAPPSISNPLGLQSSFAAGSLAHSASVWVPPSTSRSPMKPRSRQQKQNDDDDVEEGKYKIGEDRSSRIGGEILSRVSLLRYRRLLQRWKGRNDDVGNKEEIDQKKEVVGVEEGGKGGQGGGTISFTSVSPLPKLISRRKDGEKNSALVAPPKEEESKKKEDLQSEAEEQKKKKIKNKMKKTLLDEFVSHFNSCDTDVVREAILQTLPMAAEAEQAEEGAHLLRNDPTAIAKAVLQMLQEEPTLLPVIQQQTLPQTTQVAEAANSSLLPPALRPPNTATADNHDVFITSQHHERGFGDEDLAVEAARKTLSAELPSSLSRKISIKELNSALASLFHRAPKKLWGAATVEAVVDVYLHAMDLTGAHALFGGAAVRDVATGMVPFCTSNNAAAEKLAMVFGAVLAAKGSRATFTTPSVRNALVALAVSCGICSQKGIAAVAKSLSDVTSGGSTEAKKLFGSEEVRDAFVALSMMAGSSASIFHLASYVSNVTQVVENRAIFGTISVCESLATLAQRVRTAEGAGSIGFAIFNVTFNNEANRALYGTATIRDAVVSLCHHATTSDAVAKVARSFRLTVADETRALFGTEQVRSALVALCQRAASTEAVEAVSWVFRTITVSVENRKLFATAAVRDALVTLAKYAVTPEAMENVVCAVGNITFSEANKQLFSSSAMRAAVAKICESVPSFKAILDRLNR